MADIAFTVPAAVYLVACLLCGQGDGTAVTVPQTSLSECEVRAEAITRTNTSASAFCTPSAKAIDVEVAHLVAENRRLDARLAEDRARIAAMTAAEHEARVQAYYRSTMPREGR